jgi:hypothetical protein
MEVAKSFSKQYLQAYWPSPNWIDWAGSCANALLSVEGNPQAERILF